jgi:hypothetical protein
MAQFHCEVKGRSSNQSTSERTAERSFICRAENTAEDGHDMFVATGMPVAFGDAHPRIGGIFALDWSAQQDSEAWWKWTVTVSYRTPDQSQGDDPTDNPDDNPILRDPDISYDTESIMVAARGEVDNNGEITKAIVTSAEEPYDPHPEEEIEVLLINITRWVIPYFSVQLFFNLQNSVNANGFTFGDATIGEGKAKIRIRIGPTQRQVLADGSTVQFRQHDIMIAASPIGWDIELLDFGTYFKDGGKIKRFIDDGEDAKEFGLLDGSGGKLTAGAQPHYNFWKSRKRSSFAALNLPAGP